MVSQCVALIEMVKLRIRRPCAHIPAFPLRNCSFGPTRGQVSGSLEDFCNRAGSLVAQRSRCVSCCARLGSLTETKAESQLGLFVEGLVGPYLQQQAKRLPPFQQSWMMTGGFWKTAFTFGEAPGTHFNDCSNEFTTATDTQRI